MFMLHTYTHMQHVHEKIAEVSFFWVFCMQIRPEGHDKGGSQRAVARLRLHWTHVQRKRPEATTWKGSRVKWGSSYADESLLCTYEAQAAQPSAPWAPWPLLAPTPPSFSLWLPHYQINLWCCSLSDVISAEPQMLKDPTLCCLNIVFSALIKGAFYTYVLVCGCCEQLGSNTKFLMNLH